MNAAFLQRLSTRKVKITAVILAGLVVLYALIGFYLVPRLAKPRLERVLSELSHRKVEIGSLAVNPFSLSVTVRDFAIQDADGSRFIGFEEFFVNFELSSVFRRAYTFGQIALRGPYSRIRILQNGRLSFADLFPQENTQTPSTQAGDPPVILIQKLLVQNGTIEFEDRSRPTPFSTTFAELNISMENFTTRREREGLYSIEATTKAGERLLWEGDVSVVPFRSSGKLTLTGFRARTAWSYLQDRLKFEVAAGTLDASTKYRLDFSPGNSNFLLNQAALTLSDLNLRNRTSGQEVLSLPRLTVHGGEINLFKRSLTLDKILIEQLSVRAERSQDGKINLADLFTPKNTGEASIPRTIDEPTQSSGSNTSAPTWAAQLTRLELKDCGFFLKDQTTAPEAFINLSPIQATLDHLSLDLSKPLDLNLSIMVNQGGTVKLTGRVTPQPISADLAIAVDNLALSPFQPYVGSLVRLNIQNGSLYADGQAVIAMKGDSPDIGFTGNLGVKGLRITDSLRRDPLIQWDDLTLKQVRYTHRPTTLAVREILARRPFARLTINPDRTTNFQGLAVQKTPEAPLPQPPDRAKTVKEKPAKITVNRIRIMDGSLNFADLSLKPGFTTGILALNGSISGLSSAEIARAAVDLNGKVDKYAPVSIKGQINPLSEDAFTDLSVRFTGIEMSSFTPYSGKFAGFVIDKGKLNLDLRYQLSKKILVGENKIVIDQLTLGRKVESPDATSLPVRLAIALLKDSRGVIDIDLPIRGDLNDPDFRYGRIIIKVLIGIITKVASSPFKLLGSLVGGGEEMGFVGFAPGNSDLSPVEQDKLGKLAKAMVERPALTLEIRGAAAFEADQTALANRILMQQIREPDQIDAATALSPKEEGRLLALYRETFKADPKNLVPPPAKDAKRTKDQEKSLILAAARNRLQGAMSVTQEDVRALAKTRGQAIMDFLAGQAQIEPDRLFLLDSDLEGKAEGGMIRTNLGLQAR